MKDSPLNFANEPALRMWVKELRKRRELRKSAHRRPRPKKLSKTERDTVVAKTGNRCHICGGDIEDNWQADHVMAHSGGGTHDVNNYLPAHPTCNNYRWDYLPEEFELIMKLGVWTRTQIDKGSSVGRAVAEQFAKHENRRLSRRKKTTSH